MPIKLIVGLGNPGKEYAGTRHNAGAWLVELLAQQHHVKLLPEAKVKGQIAKIIFDNQECWLMIPTTFMNHSGQAVQALANFYKIAAEEILIAHDELDFPAGVIRLKQEGGHGGHNGLRDIIAHLQTKNFARLRIGIGRPENSDQGIDYVLHAPSKHDEKLIMQAIENVLPMIPDLVAGNFQKVMQSLHSVEE